MKKTEEKKIHACVSSVLSYPYGRYCIKKYIQSKDVRSSIESFNLTILNVNILSFLPTYVTYYIYIIYFIFSFFLRYT